MAQIVDLVNELMVDYHLEFEYRSFVVLAHVCIYILKKTNKQIKPFSPWEVVYG